MLKKYDELLDTKATLASDLFLKVEHPWEVLPLIKDEIILLINNLGSDYLKIAENIYVHKTAKISDKATILSPCIIGENTEVRPGSFLRGNVIIGRDCVIGNSTEVKNAIIFDQAQCPHYNYLLLVIHVRLKIVFLYLM